MPYRLIYIGLGLVAVAAIAFGVALAPEGEEVVLPSQIEAIYPGHGDMVPPQAPLEVDLQAGYEAQISVDGWPLTASPAGAGANPSDASFDEATGVYRWAPGPNHPTITEWTPGEHTITVVYNTLTGLPDTGKFEWTFRVG